MKTLAKAITEPCKQLQNHPLENVNPAFFIRLSPKPAQIIKLNDSFADRLVIDTDLWPSGNEQGSLRGVWLKLNQSLIDRLNRKRVRSSTGSQERLRIADLLGQLHRTGLFDSLDFGDIANNSLGQPIAS